LAALTQISDRTFSGPREMPTWLLHGVALVVRDYEPAIRFFVDVLQFELVEDAPSFTNDGRPKRWVVVKLAIRANAAVVIAMIFFSCEWRLKTATPRRNRPARSSWDKPLSRH
jgi:hypothetical protein